MKTKLAATFLFLGFLNGFSQVKAIDYATSKITVPANYEAASEYEIKNGQFSAQWMYLNEQLISANAQWEIIRQLEKETKPTKTSEIRFVSNGAVFTGKKLFMETAELKYRILAYGIVNNIPLILILNFKKDPVKNSDFDEIMLTFIRFE